VTRRSRRTKAEIKRIKAAIYQVAQAEKPVTLRRVFYAVMSAGLIEKTEQEYKGTICRLAAQMREKGEIAFEWFADATRWMHKPTTYNSLADALRETAEFYRRDLWHNAPVYCEVWIEKEALASAILEVTEQYDVPLMPCRGYSSISFAHGAAMTIEAQKKPAYIYHLGDFDPSGIDAGRDLEEKLHRYAPNAEIHFERLALSPEQITNWSLPTRPTKTKDPRAKNFGGQSVELDAVPLPRLRALVKRHIEEHIDQDRLDKARLAERSERNLLGYLAGYAKSEAKDIKQAVEQGQYYDYPAYKPSPTK